jgi:hypothetical protein
MYRDARRVVLLDGRQTEEIEAETGLAQGAVDSPILYDIFINDLAEALEKAGFGVVIGGRRVPLLMYADDIVLLARDADELDRMLRFVADFARRKLFVFNNDKSAVVVMASDAVRAAARKRQWLLDGRRLPFEDVYCYLGVEMGAVSTGKWNTVVDRLFQSAQARAHEQLRLHGDKHGLTPLLQSHLWLSLCCPILEYAAPIWSPQLSKTQARRLEVLQCTIARRALGLPDGSPQCFVRGELGLRSLQSHRNELVLRFFGRLCCTPEQRLLGHVFRHRLTQARDGGARQSWCTAVKPLMEQYGLDSYWHNGSIDGDEKAWIKLCRTSTLQLEIRQWQAEAERKSTLSTFCHLKSWPAAEQFLADHRNKEGRWLKLQLRGGLLRVATREASLSKSTTAPMSPRCGLCAREDETPEHFVLHCPRLALLRDEMEQRLDKRLRENAKHGPLADWFRSANDFNRLCFLLGGQMKSLGADHPLRKLFVDGDVVAAVDVIVRNFLLLAWRARASLLSDGRPIRDGRDRV